MSKPTPTPFEGFFQEAHLQTATFLSGMYKSFEMVNLILDFNPGLSKQRTKSRRKTSANQLGKIVFRRRRVYLIDKD